MNELKKIVQEMRVIVGLDLPSHCHGLQHGIQEFADRLEALSQTHVLVPVSDTNELTRTAPECIYLQVADDSEYYNEPWPSQAAKDGDITWCSDSVLECEVAYVRADLLRAAEGGEQ